jgi:alpha-amylase/alpha-mannosidase (GH57 family)
MYLTVHGHFYQPPRENPWTGRIPLQESAIPYHDWNERVCTECYAPNAHSRVLDPQGRIEEIVSNYDWIHFDFGPTLLRWMEQEQPAVYRKILEADQRSVRRFGGHGNAIAQAYNHMILPLASTRDKRTQIVWGLRDFEHRFGRPSESLWLPETAVDQETLQILISFPEIRYLILSPTQARRIRPLSGGRWTDVSGGRISPLRPYRLFLKGAKTQERRSLAVFFYDGRLAGGISFDHMLRNAGDLARNIESAAQNGADIAALVHVATDGEIYGHHEPFGDMCLAYLFAREAPRREIRVTNYGSYLDAHPPEHEVELDFGATGGGSSWSCVHGIERWRSDCGCSTGGKPGWNQAWRAPLREGLNHLRDRLETVFVDRCGALLREPWEARDDFIEIVVDRSRHDDFLKKHARGDTGETARRTIWSLLESQHQGMLMFTSCAWFFADISGIEVQQNLTYAARAIDLAQPFSGIDLEEELLGFLARAESNIPGIGTGADVWRRFVRPARKQPALLAIESFALVAAGAPMDAPSSLEFDVDLEGPEGDLKQGTVRARATVSDHATEKVFRYLVEARKDPNRVVILTATEWEPSRGGDR